MSLPDTLSALIRVAVRDLQTCRRDPRVPDRHGDLAHPGRRYLLRLPGRFGYGPDPEDTTGPLHARRNTARVQAKFRALDLVRRGRFTEAVRVLGIEPDLAQTRLLVRLDDTVPVYDEDPGAFLARLRACAGQLEAAGL